MGEEDCGRDGHQRGAEGAEVDEAFEACGIDGGVAGEAVVDGASDQDAKQDDEGTEREDSHCRGAGEPWGGVERDGSGREEHDDVGEGDDRGKEAKVGGVDAWEGFLIRFAPEWVSDAIGVGVDGETEDGREEGEDGHEFAKGFSIDRGIPKGLEA